MKKCTQSNWKKSAYRRYHLVWKRRTNGQKNYTKDLKAKIIKKKIFTSENETSPSERLTKTLRFVVLRKRFIVIIKKYEELFLLFLVPVCHRWLRNILPTSAVLISKVCAIVSTQVVRLRIILIYDPTFCMFSLSHTKSLVVEIIQKKINLQSTCI